MGKLRGFLEIERQDVDKRPVEERLRDYRELELPVPDDVLRAQASRCMDCGIPFCHDGCPLGNLVPDFNDLFYRGHVDAALASLHATNNFPEFTGRVCPAPCEASCVLALEDHAVTIKNVERGIIDRAFDAGLVKPRPSERRTGKKVAIVGSGPAGLAAAQQLARRGHDVVVFERDDRAGGLLRYGIPDFKLEKHLIDRRLDQLRAEGVVFRTGVDVGVDVTGDELRASFDAILLACGARVPRDLPVPGRELAGVHFAMEFLEQANRKVAGDDVPGQIVATGRRVVVIGGGDTGSDCIGTSNRLGAASIVQLELLPRPPGERSAHNPWPAWPLVLRTSSSHEEGAARDWSIMTTALLGDEAGRVRGLSAVRVRMANGRLEPIPGSELTLSCELVLLAMGFTGSLPGGLVAQLGLSLDARANVPHTAGRTAVPGVFVAGDMARGQSLVVWAIAEGRKVAHEIDASLAPRRRLAIAG